MKPKQRLAGLTLRILGWKAVGSLPPGMDKCVLVAAPHTSIADFIIGRLVYWKADVPVRFLMKIEFFRNPIMAWCVTRMGGIPVDRKKNNHMVQKIADLFASTDKLNVVICPEGTRKYVKHWRKGFYHIATTANVPIVLGFLNFKTKECGFGPVLYPTGDFDKDFEIIKDFYRDKTARHPEKFNLDPMYDNL